jgi:hypothetical protein
MGLKINLLLEHGLSGNVQNAPNNDSPGFSAGMNIDSSDHICQSHKRSILSGMLRLVIGEVIIHHLAEGL